MKKNILPIAILLGDPSGIGPELISKLLNNNITDLANIVVIGEKSILEDGEKISGKKTNLKTINKFDQIQFDGQTKFFLDISNGKNRTYKLSENSAQSGESVIEALNCALELAKEKKIGAINFGPFNKTSLKLAGSIYEDELHLMADKLEVKDFFCELNVVDNFWTARVTSHIPLKDVPKYIKKENILKPIRLIDKTMKLNGLKNPRIAVQALNPHAEFGTEEKDEIIPAIEEAKKTVLMLKDPCLAILHLLQLSKIRIMIVSLVCIMTLCRAA